MNAVPKFAAEALPPPAPIVAELDRMGELSLPPGAQEMVERATRHVEEFERGVIEDTVRLGELVDKTEGQPEADLDEAIETMARVERRRRKSILPLLERCETAIAKTPHRRPEWRVTVGVLFNRMRGALTMQLEQVRDARWELMAIRATRYPSKPIGPVRGKPSKLRQAPATPTT
jgi:hypothetical protein